MTSFDDMPIRPQTDHFKNTIPESSNASTSNSGVVKRPFLKRGTRMPISRIPDDATETVVAPIKNPPPTIRLKENESGQFGDEDGLVIARPAKFSPSVTIKEPRRNAAPKAVQKRPPVSVEVKFKPPPPQKTFVYDESPTSTTAVRSAWDDIASRQTEQLDHYLKSLEETDDILDTHVIHASADLGRYQDLPSPPPALQDKPSALVSKHFSRQDTESEEDDGRPARRQKGAAPPGTRKDTVGALLYGQPKAALRRPITAQPAMHAPQPPDAALAEKLRTLDEQIEKFKKENEQCRRLRLERETALGEAERLRAQATVSSEKVNVDLEEQKAALRREKKALAEEKERQKFLAQQLKDVHAESAKFKERANAAEFELKEREKRHKVETSRLYDQIETLQRRCAELETEVRAAGKYYAAPQAPLSARSEVLSESLGPEGRKDRCYRDGRKEAEFPSGLKKTVWADGRALVLFPNGDKKETGTDGVVTYSYAATGAVQTTHPNGLEVITFPSGQLERHFPDGSKEIAFPNGSVKTIAADGAEQLRLPDGTIKRLPPK